MRSVVTHFPGHGTLFEEKYLEGKAEGKSEDILRVLTVRGLPVPVVVWTSIAGALFVVISPIAPMVLCGFFVLLIALGFGLRRRRKHSVRCSLYGALGAVLAGSLDGF